MNSMRPPIADSASNPAVQPIPRSISKPRRRAGYNALLWPHRLRPWASSIGEKYGRVAVICAISLLVTLTAFEFYLHRTLKGDINNHILSGEMFGVPDALEKRGIKPLYYGPGQTGWDGQFYYFMANDLLGQKDTASHIDSPSYRYQRVGLSLYAATAALLIGQDWVSPQTFFLSYLLLILTATWFGATLLLRVGAHPALILLWSLSVGTQITLFNALPDAAADAFLILGLSAMFARRYALAALPLVLSALSREIYVLFPVLIGAMFALDQMLAERRQGGGRIETAGSFLRWRPWYWLVLPAITVIAWQIYVTVHFGATPSSQAHGVLGTPLRGWYKYFSHGLLGTHKIVPSPVWGRFEAASLLLFLGLLMTAGLLAWRILRTRFSEATALMRGIAAATLALSAVYACFGTTVAMHYTGYMKAAAILAFLIPVLMTEPGVATRRFHGRAIALLIVTVIVTGYYNWRTRILPKALNFDTYTRMSAVEETKDQNCLGAYQATIALQDIAIHNRTGILPAIFGAGDYLVVKLILKNTGHETLMSTRGSGSVDMSYQWLDSEGQVSARSERSAILTPLPPGREAELSIVSRMPSAKGDYILRLSPVQEGCAWFHVANPAASRDLKFRIE